eukprot:1159032-Pelagomonas_calceolata.AAC.2
MLSFHVEKSLAQQGSRTSSPSSSTTCLHRHAQPLSRRANSRRRLHTLRAQKQERSEAVLDLDAPSTSTPHHMAKAQEVYRTADAGIPQATSSTSNSLAELAASNPAGLATAAAALGLTTFGLVKLFNKGSRSYSNNVGQDKRLGAGLPCCWPCLQACQTSQTHRGHSFSGCRYDAWTEEGILEYYWGEHIHLGVYSEAERAAGYTKKDFKQAKYDFIDEMLRFSGAPPNPQSILDVGCGFGGTSRHLAKKFPGAQRNAQTEARACITLSPKQVERGTELAKEQGVPNASFQVMDALAMSIPDNSYDVVWACESGEHMPDKKKYVEEMVRLLKNVNLKTKTRKEGCLRGYMGSDEYFDLYEF